MNNPKRKKPLNTYIKFTSIGFQLGATIYFAAYIGKWLDTKFETEKKVFTLLLILISLAVSIWNITRQLKNMDN
jgi:uncharacterized membrane protein YfcA